MERAAIISVDGHVKAPRAGYRDYVEKNIARVGFELGRVAQA